MSLIRPLFCSVALLTTFACSSGDTPDPDAGAEVDTGVVADSGVAPLDSGVVADSGVEADAGDPPDSGVEADSGEPVDAGAGLDPLIVPGSHLQVAEGVVNVMQDSFADVKARFGAGTRTALENTRSYAWTLSGGVELTVWFANSNLDADDAPPNDVDDADLVLWAAVQGGFTGTTPSGVGLGSSRAVVEGAYGPSAKEVSLSNPAGTLLQYFTTGILIALDVAGSVRTITVHRAYGSLPDGVIDVDDARLRFGNTDIRGQDGLVPGTNRDTVSALFGVPDAQGTLRISGQDITTWSYGFIGLEFFFLDGRSTVLFMSVHAPYYGQTPGNTGVGSTRTQMEAFLSGAGYDSGTAASSNANLICYSGPQDVGVTYTAAGEVSSITTPLLACP